ncbi:21453_t:CDS:1, partial [Gigaspora margarita]
ANYLKGASKQAIPEYKRIRFGFGQDTITTKETDDDQERFFYLHQQ